MISAPIHHLGSLVIAAILALVLIGFLAYSVLLIVVAMLEKNPIRSLTAIPSTATPALSPYAQAMNAQVQEAGFTCLGLFGAAKGGIYKTATTVWLSPDRTTRVTVTGGTIASIKTRRTVLTTRSHDGRKIVTTDEFGTRDLTGMTDRQLVLNAHFPELWQIHRVRIARMSGLAALYESEDVPGQSVDDARKSAERLVQLGYARFRDAERQVWSYSLRGALKLCLDVGLLSDALAQQGRSGIKRPGS